MLAHQCNDKNYDLLSIGKLVKIYNKYKTKEQGIIRIYICY